MGLRRWPTENPWDVTNLDRYGGPELPWSRARDVLAAGPPGPEVTFFLGTSRPDGRPHAAGGGALWDEGSCTSRAEPRPGQEGVEHTMTTERHLDWDGCALSATWAVSRRWRPGDPLGRWSAPTPPPT
jgi:hypothetical protein